MDITADENQQKSVFVDEQTQKELNTPLSDPKGVGGEGEKFLKMLINLIDEGKIDLYKPETLLNKKNYSKLSEEEQGKVDIEALNLLSAIREIKGLYDSENKETYQMKNLVERIKNTKERLEVKRGDVFII